MIPSFQAFKLNEPMLPFFGAQVSAKDVGADDVGVGIDRLVEYDHLVTGEKSIAAMRLGAPISTGLPVTRGVSDSLEAFRAAWERPGGV
jgi:hypothetical protein